MTFKKYNDKRKEENIRFKVSTLWGSRSNDMCLTESSYGKDMHEELRRQPLPIERYNIKIALQWSNHNDDGYYYSGQMKDENKEGLGRLQNENFLYDGEFRNDQFDGYGR